MLPRFTNSPSLHFGHLMPMVIGRVYLHFGYPEQPMNSPNRPCFFTSPFPSNRHFSSSDSYGAWAMPLLAAWRRVAPQFGPSLQVRIAPNPPPFQSISPPQVSHYSALFSSPSG